MLTLVSKQDLWWSDRTAIEEYYSNGEFGNVIHDMLAQQDRRRFRHEMVFASLVIRTFSTGMGEVLKLNTEGCDHTLQVESLQRLLMTIDSLKTWEERT